MAENLSIVEDCSKTYDEISNFVKYCRQFPDEEIIQECIIFCNLNIEKLNSLRLTHAKTGAQKQSCHYTIHLIQSFRDDLKSMLVKEGGQLGKNVKWIESESALQKSIRTGLIKNIRHIDPIKFFKDAESIFETEIKKTLDEKNHNLKVHAILEATFAKQKGDETLEELKHFNTRAFPIFIISDIRKLFEENVSDVILNDLEEFELRDSGWTLKRLEFLNITINKFNPMRCTSFIPLPPAIAKKGACINVQNFDDQCFKWSIMSALTHLKGYKICNPYRVTEYKKYEEEFNLNFDGLEFPIQPDFISKFEKQNIDISINLYILQFIGKKFEVLPIYLTSNKRDMHIHLLMIEDKYETEVEKEIDQFDVTITKKRKMDILDENPKNHYVWIKNLSRLISAQVSNHQHAVHVCDRCLIFFHSKEKLKEHEFDCVKINKCAIKMPAPRSDQKDDSYKIMKFKNYQNKQPMPVVIYGDIEAILEKVENDKRKIHEHKICAVGYYLKCQFNDELSYYKNHVGLDSAHWFVQELRDVAEKFDAIYKNPKPMNKLTSQEEEEFIKATHCHICELPFKEGEQRVRDHSHLDGKDLFIIFHLYIY